MLRSLYEWAMRLAAGRYALPALFGVAFIEATCPFVPPDVMLAPMVLARQNRAWLFAGVCTAGSVLGGMFGYGLGFFLAPLALKLLTFFGHPDAFSAFQQLFARYGLWVILVKGLTPVPYMLVTIASGIAHFSFPVFVGASIVTRGGRFFLEAALLQHPKAKAVIDKHINLIAPIAVVLIIAALVGVRMLEHSGEHAAPGPQKPVAAGRGN
jgi:membrane protein YqaA with SNARE-associated domain